LDNGTPLLPGLAGQPTCSCTWSFHKRERQPLLPPPSQSVKSAGALENRTVQGLPPAGDHLHGELGCVGRLADVHIAAIVVQVIDAVGNALQMAPIRNRGRDRFRHLAPTPSSVLEIADQLFFLASTLMTGQPWLKKSCFCSSMYSNCALRSGCCEQPAA